jgi:hypothetical protein
MSDVDGGRNSNYLPLLLRVVLLIKRKGLKIIDGLLTLAIFRF